VHIHGVQTNSLNVRKPSVSKAASVDSRYDDVGWTG
jgi:hypothetical protein